MLVGAVLGHHAEDEFAQFFAYTPSPRTNAMPREPLLIQLESSAMPADNRLRLDKDQRLLHPGQSHNITQNNLSEEQTAAAVPTACRLERFPTQQLQHRYNLLG
jgi:hypothetical protein